MIQLHRHLAFPRNVYIHAVFLDEGRLEDAHYGLYAHSRQPLSEAQHSHVKMMIAELPKTPARVLVAGFGVGSTVRALRRAGYRVTVVTTDVNEVRIATRAAIDGVELIETSLELLPKREHLFDAVFAREVGRAADLATLLRGAHAQLAKGGRFVFAEDLPAQIARETSKAAQAVGFALGKSRGLSEAVRPTLEHYRAVIQKHRDRLKIELRMSDAGLDKFLAAVAERSQALKSGEAEYVMLTLLKS